MAPETRNLVAGILNSAWMVRHYDRGSRDGVVYTRRLQAIQMLGLAIRHAFNETDDFEPLLLALLDGLEPREEHRF